MKAEWKPRIDLNNRTKLETVIPLRTPFIIFIDPCDKCNFQCKFCPTGDRELMKKIPGRNYGIMEWDLYKKIIDDLSEFDDPVKVIRLYKDGEPLLNPRFADMVKYAKSSDKCLRVDTTTNASLLSKKIANDIIDAGLDRINISIEGVNQSQYKEFSKYDIRFEEMVENIAYLYENKKNLEMIVKINGDILSEDEKELFLGTFGDITDGIFIESIMDCWPEFKQTKVKINQTRGIYGQAIKEVLVCPYVFYSFAINSDGAASLCFLDWNRKLLIGDVKSSSLKQLWNNDIIQKYRKEFLSGKRKEIDICSNCGQLKQGQPDCIDPFRDDLLKRIIDAENEK